jgi:hypothetical protein
MSRHLVNASGTVVDSGNSDGTTAWVYNGAQVTKLRNDLIASGTPIQYVPGNNERGDILAAGSSGGDVPPDEYYLLTAISGGNFPPESVTVAQLPTAPGTATSNSVLPAAELP